MSRSKEREWLQANIEDEGSHIESQKDAGHFRIHQKNCNL